MPDTPPADPRPAVLARAAPFLRRVRIRNYKSIRFCDVTLEPLTVFVGRNGSGKSNFFDALAFLRDLMDNRISVLVDTRGGWNAIHHRGATEPDIELGFEAVVPLGSTTFQANYSIRLKLDDKRQVRLTHEHLELHTPKSRKARYTITDGILSWSEYGAEISRPHAGPRADRVLLATSDGLHESALSDLLRTSGVFAFEPSAMRPPQPQRGAALARDGHNLAAALRVLPESAPEFAERARQFLSSAVPQVVSCESVAIGDYETVRFGVLAGASGKSIFDASAVSDGTLRTLAALVAAYQVLPTGRPGFVAIEEPESGVHPFVADVLMAAFDEAALTTQVLVSTHSPDLLDARDVTPERVRVVQFIDGETVIGPVGEVDVSIVRDGLTTLGELERGDGLRVDTDAPAPEATR